MSQIREYNLRENIRAERVEKSGRIVTANGPIDVVEGEYIIHRNGGTERVNGQEFEDKYAPVSDSDSENDGAQLYIIHRNGGTKNDRESAFSPVGKSVAQVIEYMNAHPEEVEAIKRREGESNTPRKGIMGYESR